MKISSKKAYSVPLRAIWLQSQDVIDVRITISGGRSELQIFHFPVTAHLNPMNKQLLGVILLDNKILRLGRWLRANWEEVPIADGDPIPSGVVVYDEGALFAYLSIWPNLGGDEPEMAERLRAEVHINAENELTRIRFPVTVRRHEDGLAVAAGYLPTR